MRSVLALHRHVSGSRTEVDIRDGVITLRGAATSEAQKELATEYAEDVKGVLRVTNVMTVVVAPAKADDPRSKQLMTPPSPPRSRWPCNRIVQPVPSTPRSERPMASLRSAASPRTWLKRR